MATPISSSTSLRLSSRQWSQLFDRMQQRLPRNEPEYRQMELLLRREHVLQSTLQTMQILQHRGTHAQPQSRYFADDDAEQEQQWSEEWELDTYFGDDPDGVSEDGYSTTSSQWADENLRDPWGAERISHEYMAAQADPTHAAKLYWTARRAMRRHRAAVGRFGHRSHFRRRKGKGKGKGKSKGKNKFPVADTPFSNAPILPAGGGKGKRGKGKGKGKSGGLFWTHDDEAWQEDTTWSDAWRTGDEYTYDSEIYAASDGKGKNKGKGKGRDICHICGKPGHWKNECPINATMFSDLPEDTPQPEPLMQRPARGVHFAAAHGPTSSIISSTQQSLPGAVYVTQECEQLLEHGEELPGEEVPEPYYMAITDDPEQQMASAASAKAIEETETAEDTDFADSDDDYIVEGRLKIT
eukprot:4525053-Amphidinium_carterae.2